MAETRSGIIKRKDVGATGAVDAEDILLGRALRIPGERVARKAGDQPPPAQLTTRLSRHATIMSDRPVDVGPGPIDRPLLRITAEEAVEPHEPTIEEIEEAWNTRLAAARSEAREEGIAHGRAEAETAFKQEAAALRESFAADLQSIQHAWESFVRRAEPWILQLSFRVAAAILDAPIPDDVRRVNERAVAAAVESMADGIPLEVVLHPVSFLRIKESGIYEQLISNNSKLRWRTNTEVKQNEWIVQSQRAVTRRLESELIERLRHELSLLEIHRPDDASYVRSGEEAATNEKPPAAPQNDTSSRPDDQAPAKE